eukprot:1105617-Pleurochrysis_carterae.AAC.1
MTLQGIAKSFQRIDLSHSFEANESQLNEGVGQLSGRRIWIPIDLIVWILRCVITLILIKRQSAEGLNRCSITSVRESKIIRHSLFSQFVFHVVVGDTSSSTLHRYGRGATSRGASARCVLRGFVSETKIDETTYKANYGAYLTCGEGSYKLKQASHQAGCQLTCKHV